MAVEQDISESGFKAVHKLMKGDTAAVPPCAICLEQPVEGGTVVTSCW